MTNTHSVFLKEMGITEWIPLDTSLGIHEPMSEGSVQSSPVEQQNSVERTRGMWWFFGNVPQGDAQVLFQNIIRVLGIARDEWAWKNPSDKLSELSSPNVPVVAVAFGGSVAQKITGERDPLPQLRETILAMNTGNEEDIPVVASFELNQILMQPKEKALLWQDLMLARSVLQNS